MRKIIVERIVLVTRRSLPHEIIVVVSADDAVDKRCSLKGRTTPFAIIAKMQRHTAITGQSIELSDRTMREFGTATNQANAVAGRIGNLAIADSHHTLASIQPMSAHIVDRGI